MGVPGYKNCLFVSRGILPWSIFLGYYKYVFFVGWRENLKTITQIYNELLQLIFRVLWIHRQIWFGQCCMKNKNSKVILVNYYAIYQIDKTYKSKSNFFLKKKKKSSNVNVFHSK